MTARPRGATRCGLLGGCGLGCQLGVEVPSAGFPRCPWVGRGRICVSPGPVTETTQGGAAVCKSYGRPQNPHTAPVPLVGMAQGQRRCVWPIASYLIWVRPDLLSPSLAAAVLQATPSLGDQHVTSTKDKAVVLFLSYSALLSGLFPALFLRSFGCCRPAPHLTSKHTDEYFAFVLRKPDSGTVREGGGRGRG